METMFTKKSKYHNTNLIELESETCFVESMNAKISRQLARFNCKTYHYHYSKAIDVVIASLILLFNEKIIQCIFG